MKNVIMLCAVLLFDAIACSMHAESGAPFMIYAAVLRATAPPGGQPVASGLYAVPEDGRNVKYLGTKNTFGFDVFPEKNLIYSCAGNGVFVSRDKGRSWKVTTGWTMTEIQYVSALRSNPGVVYAGTPYGLFKSTEYGENFKQLTDKFIECLLLDAVNPDKVYIGQEDGLYVSIDGGRTFTKNEMNFGSQVNALAQNPKSPDILYAGTEDKGIFMTTNGGKTWIHCPAPADSTTVYGITVDPSNPERIFAGTYKDGVLRSTDGGNTWQAFRTMETNMPVFSIAVNPNDPKVIYASANNLGLLKSDDNGETWKKFALDGAQAWRIDIK